MDRETAKQGGADAMAAAIRLYRETDSTKAAIEDLTGVSPSRLYRALRRAGLPLRRDVRAARAAVSVPDLHALGRGDVPLDRRTMALRLERLVGSRIAAVEAQEAGDAVTGERQARTLSNLTRTASAVRKYLTDIEDEEGTGDAVAAEPPRSLSELRDELRGHLERIREEERRGLLRGAPDPE